MPSRAAVEKNGAEVVARVGYTASAIVYATIAILALMLALGVGGQTTGGEGAINTLAEQPFGATLVALVGVGLLALAAWRFVQALRDTEGKGRDAKGKLVRTGYAISGVLHAVLGFYAFRVLQGRGGGGGGGAQSTTARLLTEPFGQALVALVGAGIAAFGLQQLHKAWRGNVLRKHHLHGLAAGRRTTLERVCRGGLASRGIVFLLMAIFFFRAALQSDAGEAKGLGETLATVAQQPLGSVLLGIVALGLLGFAVYQVLEARFRRIQVP